MRIYYRDLSIFRLGLSVRQFIIAIPRREPRRRPFDRSRSPFRHDGEAGVRSTGTCQSAKDRRPSHHFGVGDGTESQEIRVAGCARAVAPFAASRQHALRGPNIDNEYVRRRRTPALSRLLAVRYRFE